MRYSIVLSDFTRIDCLGYNAQPHGVYYWLKNKMGKKKDGTVYCKDVQEGYIPVNGYQRIEILP